jgi:predicted secreted hydrolase
VDAVSGLLKASQRESWDRKSQGREGQKAKEIVMKHLLIAFMTVMVFAAGAVYGGWAEGYAFLEGESNHSGIRVEFYRYPIGEICFETFTDESGYYSVQHPFGWYYDVVFSRHGFLPERLEYVYIKPIGVTTLPSVTLKRHLLCCEDLDWEEYPYRPPGTSIEFPSDEGKHNPVTTFPIEWWYANFHLIGESTGTEYGAFVAFFKVPPMRLFSIVDLGQEMNYTNSKLVGVLTADQYKLDLYFVDELGDPDYWRDKTFCEGFNPPFHYRLDVDGEAKEDGKTMKLDVFMLSSKAPMMVGGDGLVEIGDGWSYYYSHTKVEVTGKITVHGRTEEVTGFAWIDHQWGNFVAGETVTWEWFSIKLDDLREIMVADVWVDGQLQGSFSDGLNLFNDDCSLTLLDEYTITPFAFWVDPVSERRFATKWRIKEESKGINLNVTADFDNQVMRLNPGLIFPVCFWEGTCSVTGTIEGMQVSGRAYAELTHSNGPTAPIVILSPDARIVPRGGKLGYTVEVINNTEDDIMFEYWSDVYLWNGEPYNKNPVFGPYGVTLKAGATRSGHLSHKVPNSAPLKTYTMCGRIGFHPDEVWDEDCFQFTVVEPSGYGIEGEPWEVIESTF